jgi:hypothetical protein
MTGTMRLLMLATAVTLLTTAPAHAKKTPPYPTNVCVAAKQDAAGAYCARALRAWARSQKGGRTADADRTAALQKARAHLAGDWQSAESKSSRAGVDCADTTDSATQLASLVDSAVGAIVAGADAGLDLDRKGDRSCAYRLLTGAAKTCARLLAAESELVGTPLEDPKRTRHDARTSRIDGSFAKSVDKTRAHGCPATTTGSGLAGLVGDAAGDIVQATTLSPNVPADSFVTISPTGTVHYLGRDLQAQCMNGSPYHFFAKRGSVNKLLVYYQGGGACWDQTTCSLPTCDTSVDPSNPSDNPGLASSGFYDLSDPRNPFRDWNIVFVAYCSCDVHFGDAAQNYPLHVEHRGYENSRIVEKWAREHFVNPDQVFVTGSSAGAYGAWFNAPLHETVWPAAQFQVLADAGNGVITDEFLHNEFGHWNFTANIPPNIPGVVESITNGTGIVGYTEAITKFFPDTRWAHYATAYDGGSGGQTGFYNLMLTNSLVGAVNWWGGSCAFDAKMLEQVHETASAVPSNYRYYVGTGSRHTMWYAPKVYTDTTGGVPTLVDWVNGMLAGTSAWTNVECTDCGKLLPGDPRPPTIPTPPFFQDADGVRVHCGAGSPSGAFVAE